MKGRGVRDWKSATKQKKKNTAQYFTCLLNDAASSTFIIASPSSSSLGSSVSFLTNKYYFRKMIKTQQIWYKVPVSSRCALWVSIEARHGNPIYWAHASPRSTFLSLQWFLCAKHIWVIKLMLSLLGKYWLKLKIKVTHRFASSSHTNWLYSVSSTTGSSAWTNRATEHLLNWV